MITITPMLLEDMSRGCYPIRLSQRTIQATGTLALDRTNRQPLKKGCTQTHASLGPILILPRILQIIGPLQLQHTMATPLPASLTLRCRMALLAVRIYHIRISLHSRLYPHLLCLQCPNCLRKGHHRGPTRLSPRLSHPWIPPRISKYVEGMALIRASWTTTEIHVLCLFLAEMGIAAPLLRWPMTLQLGFSTSLIKVSHRPGALAMAQCPLVLPPLWTNRGVLLVVHTARPMTL